MRFIRFVRLIDILSQFITEKSRVPPPLDLSGITKLKNLELRWGDPNIQWIVMSLSTVKSESLQQITITIGLYASFIHPVEASTNREWRDLDHLLIQLWTSRSILPRIKYQKRNGEDKVGELLSELLPKLASRGVVGAFE